MITNENNQLPDETSDEPAEIEINKPPENEQKKYNAYVQKFLSLMKHPNLKNTEEILSKVTPNNYFDTYFSIYSSIESIFIETPTNELSSDIYKAEAKYYILNFIKSLILIDTTKKIDELIAEKQLLDNFTIYINKLSDVEINNFITMWNRNRNNYVKNLKKNYPILEKKNIYFVEYFDSKYYDDYKDDIPIRQFLDKITRIYETRIQELKDIEKNIKDTLIDNNILDPSNFQNLSSINNNLRTSENEIGSLYKNFDNLYNEIAQEGEHSLIYKDLKDEIIQNVNEINSKIDEQNAITLNKRKEKKTNESAKKAARMNPNIPINYIGNKLKYAFSRKKQGGKKKYSRRRVNKNTQKAKKKIKKTQRKK